MAYYNDFFKEDIFCEHSLSLFSIHEDNNDQDDLSMDDPGASDNTQQQKSAPKPQAGNADDNNNDSTKNDNNQDNNQDNQNDNDNNNNDTNQNDNDDQDDDSMNMGDDDTSSDDTSSDDQSDDSSGDDDTTDDSETDDGMGGDDTPDPNQKLKDLEASIFNQLTPQQKGAKTKELKNLYDIAYQKCANLIDLINSSEKAQKQIKVCDFVVNSLTDLQKCIKDYLVNIFDSKTYMENMIEFNKYLTALNTVSNVIAELNGDDEKTNKKSKSTSTK